LPAPTFDSLPGDFLCSLSATDSLLAICKFGVYA
jgi:hypothetical protein